MTTQGPFGRNNHGREIVCDGGCTCCGEAMRDMPDTIYARIVVSTFLNVDVYVPLYKQRVQSDQCSCGAVNVTSIDYYSPLFYLSNDTTPSDAVVCCGVIHLQGVCLGDECEWFVRYYNPISAVEDLADPYEQVYPTVDAVSGDRITCGTLEGFVDFAQNHNGNACLFSPFSPTLITEITISQTIPGGSAALLCDKLCCGLPTEVYVTITADDEICPGLDGQVVTLHYYSTSGQVAGTEGYNPFGEHIVTWVGYLIACGCCPTAIPITVTNSTWTRTIGADPDDARCKWSISVGVCFTESIEEVGDDGPCAGDVIFTGTWAEACFACCTEDSEVTIEVDF
jgi:hypothetical protein